MPQETPSDSRLWRSQYFPLLRNIRINTNTPSQTPATRLSILADRHMTLRRKGDLRNCSNSVQRNNAGILSWKIPERIQAAAYSNCATIIKNTDGEGYELITSPYYASSLNNDGSRTLQPNCHSVNYNTSRETLWKLLRASEVSQSRSFP